MSTKATTISNAYNRMRISGLTVTPSTADNATALAQLEQMMAELYLQRGLNVSYNFETTPASASQTGVDLGFQNMMEANLAKRLCPYFGKDVPPQMDLDASQSLSGAIGLSVQFNTRDIQPSRRMPLGSGNTFRNVWWDRFARPQAEPPPEPQTNYILQGETLKYYEDFAAFLGSATISSYTIVCDPLLTIDTSAIVTTRITYTITAPADLADQGSPLQQVKITIVDSTGRTLIRIINFGVQTPPTIPQS